MSKVKSRSHHDNAHVTPPKQCRSKYLPPAPYNFQDIALTRFLRPRSQQTGQRSNQAHTMTLHTSLKFLPNINIIHLDFFSKMKPKVTMVRSKVKSRSYYNVLHLQPPTNVSTKFETPIPHHF